MIFLGFFSILFLLFFSFCYADYVFLCFLKTGCHWTEELRLLSGKNPGPEAAGFVSAAVLASHRAHAGFSYIPTARASVSLVHSRNYQPLQNRPSFSIRWSAHLSSCWQCGELVPFRLVPSFNQYFGRLCAALPPAQTTSLGCGSSALTFHGLESRVKCQRDTSLRPSANTVQM